MIEIDLQTGAQANEGYARTLRVRICTMPVAIPHTIVLFKTIIRCVTDRARLRDANVPLLLHP